MNGDKLTPQESSKTGAGETRQRIIMAASQAFSEQGYARSTTRGIAAAAGVTEVTLFRHFGSKQNLFAAVLEQYSARPDFTAIRENITGDCRQDLLNMGRHFMRIMVERRDTMRMMLCEADHFPELRDTLVQMPRMLRQMVAAYLRQQMEQGNVRELHPEVMGQAFVSLFFAYNLYQSIFTEEIVPELSEEELVNQFVDIFLDGII